MASSECSIQGVISLYTDLALNPNKDFGWAKGRDNAKSHGYKDDWITALPSQIWDYCAAVGNPFHLGDFFEGAVIADLGCGAGVDACVAALQVGPLGHVIGVDITPSMVQTAKRHASEAGFHNIEIREGNLEHLPIEDGSIDIVISNGAINLASSKPQVFSEIYRVLKPGGHLYFADMVDVSDKSSCQPCCSAVSSNNWANCVEGTLRIEELLDLMTRAGFVDCVHVETNHYATSDKTYGATFKAVKGDTNVTQRHWEHIYTTKDIRKVGWYQERPDVSLSLVKQLGSIQDSIIDIGCGASTLVDHLMTDGYTDITLLDISQSALDIIKNRLSDSCVSPIYMCGDVCGFDGHNVYDVWHDRAVFHFFQSISDQKKYFDVLHSSIKKNGYAIIGTFSVNGPNSCSSLPVRQYDENSIRELCQDRFELLKIIDDVHITPSGSEQKYTYFILRSV